jgi:hypothetical protein
MGLPCHPVVEEREKNHEQPSELQKEKSQNGPMVISSSLEEI